MIATSLLVERLDHRVDEHGERDRRLVGVAGVVARPRRPRRGRGTPTWLAASPAPPASRFVSIRSSIRLWIPGAELVGARQRAEHGSPERRMADSEDRRGRSWGLSLSRSLGSASLIVPRIGTRPRARAPRRSRARSPASAWRITPVPGSLVSTRSSFSAASSVPSATQTIPAWIERPMPTPPPWWIETQRGARGGVDERVQQRPVGDRVGAVAPSPRSRGRARPPSPSRGDRGRSRSAR